MANLPQLLDQNHVMGWVMTPPVLAILQHCPCPPQGVPPTDHQQPTYSLWYLEPHIRRSWLMSLLVILYKVKLKYSNLINNLITIQNYLIFFSVNTVNNRGVINYKL